MPYIPELSDWPISKLSFNLVDHHLGRKPTASDFCLLLREVRRCHAEPETMSGLEIIGLAASVLQIADYGWKTSYKLYAFSKKVHEAGKTIELISQDISATGAVLKQLGDEVGRDEKANADSRLCSQGLIDAAHKLVEECKDLFKEIDISIGGKYGNKVILGFKQKLKWSYLEPRVELLRTNLERLKSSLALMLSVLMYAEQIRSREEQSVLAETQILVASFATQKADAEKDIVQLRRSIEHDTATAVHVFASKDGQQLKSLTEDQAPSVQPEADLLRETSGSAFTGGSPQVSQVNSVCTSAAATTVTSNEEYWPQFALDKGLDETAEASKSDPIILNLQHQRALIEKLLEEVNSSSYAIDHGVRYRLHDGVLDLHWLEWSPLRESHGDDLLRGLLAQSPILARHWHERLGVAKEPARPPRRHLAEGVIAETGATERLRNHRNHRKQKRRETSDELGRNGHDVDAGGLGTVAGEHITRDRSRSRQRIRSNSGGRGGRSRSRRRRRSYRKLSRSTSRTKNLAGAGLGAAAVAAAAIYSQNRKTSGSKEDEEGHYDPLLAMLCTKKSTSLSGSSTGVIPAGKNDEDNVTYARRQTLDDDDDAAAVVVDMEHYPSGDFSSNLATDPYQILGIPQDADGSIIRSAYLKLIRKAHPDLRKAEAEKLQDVDEFHRVQQAYDLLSDPDRRIRYDHRIKSGDWRTETLSWEPPTRASGEAFLSTRHRGSEPGIDTKTRVSTGGGRIVLDIQNQMIDMRGSLCNSKAAQALASDRSIEHMVDTEETDSEDGIPYYESYYEESKYKRKDPKLVRREDQPDAGNAVDDHTDREFEASICCMFAPFERCAQGASASDITNSLLAQWTTISPPSMA